jgi:hypothetical protein
MRKLRAHIKTHILHSGLTIIAAACIGQGRGQPAPEAGNRSTTAIDSVEAVAIARKSFSEVSETDPELIYVAGFARDSTGFLMHLAIQHPNSLFMLGGTETIHVRFDGKIDMMVIDQ